MDSLLEGLGMRKHPSEVGWCSSLGGEGWMRWPTDITSHPTLPRSVFMLCWNAVRLETDLKQLLYVLYPKLFMTVHLNLLCLGHRIIKL